MTLEEMFRRIVRAHLALILVCILVPVAGAAILVANRPDPSIASIRLQVECIEAELTDLGPAWKARSKPQHPGSEPGSADA